MAGLRLRTRRFTASLYSGTTPTTTGIPARWPCALAGRGYMLDDRQAENHLERSVAGLKANLGAATDEPGEASLNPDAAWRRATSSWHGGAGQSHFDAPDSDRARFDASKGLNPWVRGQLSLLPDVDLLHSAAGTPVQVVASQGYLYFTDGNNVRRTDGTTVTTCTGTPAAAVTSIASSGSAVYAAFGASDVYKIVGTAGSSFVGDDMDVVGFAKQRILGADANTLYDLSSGSSVSVRVHADTGFAWSCFGEGRSHIYVGGNASTAGAIYRISVTDDASALGQPVVAARLPEGELVHALFGYAGVLFIGTSRGWRAADQASTGDLEIGPLVETGGAVMCFAAWGQYVWFGWSNYDAASTGLGRISPTTLNATGAYAYASDLMVTGQGRVSGIALLGGKVCLGVDALGLYREATATVTSGTLDVGIVGWGITENKLLTGATLGYTGGTASLSVNIDSGGVYEPVNEAGYNQSGVQFEPRIALSTGAVLRSMVLRAFSQHRNTRMLFAPLRLSPWVTHPETGVEERFDINAAMSEIRDLWELRTVTTYQIGVETFVVIVEDYERTFERPVDEHKRWAGTVVVKLKVVQ